jgi:hypothetical protein
MVAVGMNKAAEEFLILDERTREDLASGKYRDQRRGSFGSAAPAPGRAGAPGPAAPAGTRLAGCSRSRCGVQGPASQQPACRGPDRKRSSRCCITSKDFGQPR